MVWIYKCQLIILTCFYVRKRYEIFETIKSFGVLPKKSAFSSCVISVVLG